MFLTLAHRLGLLGHLINLDKAKLIIHACLSARKNTFFQGWSNWSGGDGYLMRFFHYDSISNQTRTPVSRCGSVVYRVSGSDLN